MIKRRPINLPYIMMKNFIMENDKKKKKQKSLSYDQYLLIIFKYFDIKLTDTNKTPYFKYLEIDHKTLTNMKFVLNKDGAWVAIEQMWELKWRVCLKRIEWAIKIIVFNCTIYFLREWTLL